MRIDDYWLPQRAQQLPALEGHEAIRSDALREFGEYLLQRVAPALLKAMRLRSSPDGLPMAHREATRRSQVFDPTTYRVALCQLESANQQRTMFDKRLGWSVVSWASVAVRSVELIAGAVRIICLWSRKFLHILLQAMARWTTCLDRNLPLPNSVSNRAFEATLFTSS